eukprot:gene20397-22410_t
MGLLWKLALVIIPIAIFISVSGIYKVIHEIHDIFNRHEKLKEQVNPNTWHLFTKFDKDFDGHLDANEFQTALEYTLKQVTQQGLENEVDEYTARIGRGRGMQGGALNTEVIKQNLATRSISVEEEFLTLTAKFKPLDLASLSKYKNEHGMDILGSTHLKGLHDWQAPFVSQAKFTSQDFKVFLPQFDVRVGDIWDIITPVTAKYERALSHNRMYPTIPKSQNEKFITRLLSMFHPRPFVQTRFVPQGTFAVLRAINEKYYDIVFRIHAEFQINEPPNFPFWFTPAQFMARLIIDKTGEHIEDFRMSVPTDKRLNVDHIDDAWEMEVDIGFMREMSLQSDGPTRKSTNEIPKQKEFIWTTEISESQARRLLQQKFYPFQRVLYRPFNETFDVAEKEEKLVHNILLWGSGRTLREGALESSPILELLEKHFVSSWSLVADLRDLSANKTESLVRNAAKICLDTYKFPVQSMVQFPNGTVLSSLNANDLLDITQDSTPGDLGDPVNRKYYSFLKDALRKSGKDEE